MRILSTVTNDGDFVCGESGGGAGGGWESGGIMSGGFCPGA